jgi:hypothetical protein
MKDFSPKSEIQRHADSFNTKPILKETSEVFVHEVSIEENVVKQIYISEVLNESL